MTAPAPAGETPSTGSRPDTSARDEALAEIDRLTRSDRRRAGFGDADLDRVARLISDGLGGDGVALLKVSSDGEWLDRAGLHEPGADQDRELRRLLEGRIRVGENASSRVMVTHEPFVVPTIDPELFRIGAIPRFRPFFERWPAYGTVAVPASIGGRAVGMVLTLRHRRDDPYDDATTSWLCEVGRRVGPLLDDGDLVAAMAEQPGATAPLLRGAVGVALAVLLPAITTFVLGQFEEPTVYRPTAILVVIVVVVAILGGLRAAMIATATSAVLLWWAVFPPQGSFELQDDSYRTGLIAFLVSCAVVVVTVEVVDRVRARVAERERHLTVVRQQELTRRLAAAEQQALSDSRFRSLVEATSSLAWIADGHGDLVERQAAWETATGQPWPDHQGSGWLAMIAEEDRPLVVQTWRQAVEQGVAYEASARLWSAGRREHRHTVLRAAPIRDRNGTVVEWIATMNDVDERYRLMQELNETQAQLSMMMDANVLAFVFGRDDVVEDANDLFLRLVGRTRAELEAGVLTRASITAPGWEEVDRHALAELVDRGRAEPYEKEYLRPDGTRVPVEIGVAVLQRRPFRWAAYVRDLTERKVAERALLDAYEQRDHVARTLQTSLLPPTLPDVAGLRLAARYLPSPVGEGVGGDFYDVYPDADGAWHLHIGDVCGRGPDAAALTGLARYTLRASSINESDPIAILGVLNDAVRGSVDDGRFCTVAYTTLRRDDGRWRGSLALGGHHPLRLLRNGSVQHLGAPGTLIGVFRVPLLERVDFELEPGDILVAFTDGLIEQHHPPFDDRDLDVVLGHLASVGAELDEVMRALESHVPPEPDREDDTAILAVQVR